MRNRIKKQLFLNLPYFLVFYVGNKMSWLFRRIRLEDFWEKILYAMNHMKFAFQPPFPSIHWKDIAIGMIVAVTFKGIVSIGVIMSIQRNHWNSAIMKLDL